MGSAEQLGAARHRTIAPRKALPPAAAWGLIVLAGLCRCLLLTGLAVTSWTVIPGWIGFGTTTVMSGSMAPRFQVGDAVITRPVGRADLAVGQVLQFDDPDEPGALRLHRLMSARGDRLLTKGDANESEDSSPVRFDAVHGVGFLRVPYAGMPAYWLRTGRFAPVLGLAAVAMLLVAGTRLDRRFNTARHADRDARAARRRAPRHHWGAVAPVVLVLAVCTSSLVPGPARASATFSTRTSNASNVLKACVDYPVRSSLPTSALVYFNYMEGSGSTTAERSHPSTSGTVFGSTTTRGAGTCTPGASPYLHVGDSSTPGGVIAPTSSGIPADVTIATWFRTNTGSGMLADIGSNTAGGSSPQVDRVLYMTPTGALVIGAVALSLAGLPVGLATCQTPPGNANGAWHLVIATFSATNGCTIAVDGAAPVSGTAAVNTNAGSIQVLSTFAGRWRFGYDATSILWPNVGGTAYFRGDLDESQVYSSILTTNEQSAIVSRGH